MMKNFIEQIKLSKLSYLLEIIEVRDFKSKIKAYNKIRQMKITKEMGLLILDAANFEHKNTYSDFNISLSLISLLFKEYYEEYSDKLKEIYPKLTLESKYEVLNLLANSNNISAILLYKELVLKYGKELDDIPIGNLSSVKENYELLFPDLIKALKFNIKRNNILLLLNDFFNQGVVVEKDIKKNKKIISDYIIKILKEGVNYKFKKEEYIMQNKDYINLRMFLESVTNIEFFVSTKDTKTYLEKLLKKKDNQIKLFILENYVKKGKDISKISLNTIAKDLLSRYPLYSFLKFYSLEKLMPKKYNNNLALSESDLYINYCILNRYESHPEKLEFIKEKIVEDHKYYIYKFETKFNYYEEVKDPGTDYIFKNTSLDKVVMENGILNYIGISGGYNKDLDPSLIEKNITTPLYKKYSGDIDKIIEELLPKKEIVKKIETIKEKLPEKKKLKDIIKKKEKVKEEVTEVPVKPVEEPVELPSVEQVIEEPIEENRPSILRRIFSFNTLLILVCLVFAGSLLLLITYLNGMDLLNLKNTSNSYTNIRVITPVQIKDDRFKEISYENIFKQEQKEYYVLFYNNKQKSVYHSYLKTLIDNNYKIYFVNVRKESNQPIYQGNSTGFTIKEDTFLKVNEGEYEFYVVGKLHILNEMKDYIDVINKKKAEEEKKKQAEEAEKKKENEMKETIKKVLKNNNKNICKCTIKNNIDFYAKKIYNLNINAEKEE